jgi:hypothetical protein
MKMFFQILLIMHEEHGTNQLGLSTARNKGK